MIDKAERVFDSINRADIVLLLALDHNDRDTQRAGGSDLAIGRRAAAVLGDDDFDPVLDQKCAFGGLLEGAGRQNVLRMGYAELRHDGIDAPDQIAVLRCAFEIEDLLSADGEENAFWGGIESLNRLSDGVNIRPAIAGLRFPRGAAQGKKRNSGAARRDDCIVRDARRKGMGGIDQKVEIFSLQKLGKPVAATEAAAAGGNRLCHRLCRSSGQRKQAVAIGALRQGSGQLPRLGRAAKNQDAVFAHG